MIAAGIDAFVVTLFVGVWAKIDLYAFLKIKHFFLCVCAKTYKTYFFPSLKTNSNLMQTVILFAFSRVTFTIFKNPINF